MHHDRELSGNCDGGTLEADPFLELEPPCPKGALGRGSRQDDGRDFAAWLGLTPVQRSSGGKERLGKTSKMGERSLRRLLIIGASAVARWAVRKGVPAGSWLGRMLARKPPMLVRVALANTMARIVWALMAKGGTYQTPAASA